MRAAERSQARLLEIVGGVVGGTQRYEYAALLMTSAHATAGLEVSEGGGIPGVV